MRKLLLVLFAMGIMGVTYAQDAPTKNETKGPWAIKGETGVTYSNAYFSDYWAAGGDNSNSLLWRGIISANRTGAKGTWDNTLDLSYGLIKQGDLDLRKMNDKIDFLSKYSIKGFSKKWRYTALFNFKSQFAEGFKYKGNSSQVLVSDFFAPSYVTASIGLEYLGSDKLKVFISPFSDKTTMIKESFYDKKVDNYVTQILRDPEYDAEEGTPISDGERELAETALETTTTYGLDWRDNVKTEIGAMAQVIYDHPDMVKGFGLKTRLDLFAAYENIDKVDIDWEIWLTFKFTEWLSMNINTQMVYDDDVRFAISNDDGSTSYSPKIQFRNLFGVGLVYTFKN